MLLIDNFGCDNIMMVSFMKKEKKKLDKVDKITRIFTISVSVILGSIFLAACVYLLKMIQEEQQTNKITANYEVQSVNLVNM